MARSLAWIVGWVLAGALTVLRADGIGLEIHFKRNRPPCGRTGKRLQFFLTMEFTGLSAILLASPVFPCCRKKSAR